MNTGIIKTVLLYLCIQLCFLVAPFFIPKGYEISSIFILLWMMRGPLQVLQGLSLIIVVRNLNPTFVDVTLELSLIGWAAIAIAIIVSMVNVKERVISPLVAILAFSLFAVVSGYFNSPNFDVTAMKVFSFTVFSFAIMIFSFCKLDVCSDAKVLAEIRWLCWNE